jgi:hypothetical protein
VTVDELALATSQLPATVEQGQYLLHSYRLARPDLEAGPWSTGCSRHRPTAANALGVLGVLVARARRIGAERAVGEWGSGGWLRRAGGTPLLDSDPNGTADGVDVAANTRLPNQWAGASRIAGIPVRQRVPWPLPATAVRATGEG